MKCALRIDLSSVRGADGDPRWLLTTVARPGLLTAAGFGRPGRCGVSSTWERGFAGVGERVEKSHRVRDGREWLSYSEQCLVRRFALR